MALWIEDEEGEKGRGGHRMVRIRLWEVIVDRQTPSVW